MRSSAPAAGARVATVDRPGVVSDRLVGSDFSTVGSDRPDGCRTDGRCPGRAEAGLSAMAEVSDIASMDVLNQNVYFLRARASSSGSAATIYG